MKVHGPRRSWMGAVEPDLFTSSPPRRQILQKARAASANCKPEPTRFALGQPQIIFDYHSRLFGQLEPYRSAGLLLPNCYAVLGAAAGRQIVDPDSNDIAAT